MHIINMIKIMNGTHAWSCDRHMLLNCGICVSVCCECMPSMYACHVVHCMV